jgi:hypothetical protein
VFCHCLHKVRYYQLWCVNIFFNLTALTESMKKVVLFALLSVVTLYAYATHIVGGEFEITHIEGDRYLFRQIQYFDVVNGNEGAKDEVIDASIFRQRDDVFVRSVVMFIVSESFVPYTNPECTNARLITNRIVYEREVELDPNLFSDPEGYYMVWERCCRNNIITNIIRPDETGQTFYIEFPPIRKGGAAYRNSSPQLFPPLSDYACVDRFYYVDFRGFDPDGDSLVYSLVKPLNSSVFEPLPVPTPAPHPTVIWAPGISTDFQVPGNPTLEVNEAGFLTVTPSEEGLFVFSVMCEEFREGQKIGEVVRDFQLFVIDCPDPGNAPEILVQAPGTDIFVSKLDTVRLKAGDDRCFDFKISDQDGSETVFLRAEAVNFEESLDGILSTTIGQIETPEDTLNAEVCLPECPYLLDEPFIIDIIAGDFTCPLPLMDTMRLLVIVEPPLNEPPQFVAPVEETLTLTFLEGSVIDLPFSVTDADLDSLLLEVVGVDFDLDEFGIQIDTLVFEDGKIDFALSWNTDCRVYPFADKNEFQLKFYVEDDDLCGYENRDSVIVNVNIVLPDNNSPVVLVEDSPEDQELTVRVGDQIVIDVRALDGDPTDLLTLEAIALGFNFADIGLLFEDQEGNSNIGTDLTWDVPCDAVTAMPGGSYEILFVSDDADKCKVQNFDTTRLTINVLPPLNNAPQVVINNAGVGDTVFVNAGNLLDLDILASDLDNDSISVELLNPETAQALGVLFDGSGSNEDIYSSFGWQTDCSLLGSDFADSLYSFSIVVNDYQCFSPKSDTLVFHVVIQDSDFDLDFVPPNVFTPNAQDTINATFYIPNLPGDNCRRQFKEILIVNRSGKEVFVSREKDFHWDGSDNPTGVYYYLVTYSDYSFRGTISLLR